MVFLGKKILRDRLAVMLTTEDDKFASISNNISSVSEGRILWLLCVRCGFQWTSFRVTDAFTMTRAKTVPDNTNTKQHWKHRYAEQKGCIHELLRWAVWESFEPLKSNTLRRRAFALVVTSILTRTGQGHPGQSSSRYRCMHHICLYLLASLAAGDKAPQDEQFAWSWTLASALQVLHHRPKYMLKPTLVFDVCILTDEKMSLLHNQQAIPKSILKNRCFCLFSPLMFPRSSTWKKMTTTQMCDESGWKLLKVSGLVFSRPLILIASAASITATTSSHRKLCWSECHAPLHYSLRSWCRKKCI